MYEQVEKTKENKSRAIGNSVAQMKNSGKQGFGFVDNREEAVAQRKLHMMAQDYSPRQVVQMNPINGEPRTVTVCDENQKPLYNFQEGCFGEFNYKKGDKISPGTTTDGKKAAWDKFCISGNTNAYQLHIVNAKWGGMAEPRNLIPGSKQLNENHKNYVENFFSSCLNNKSIETCSYKCEINSPYGEEISITEDGKKYDDPIMVVELKVDDATKKGSVPKGDGIAFVHPGLTPQKIMACRRSTKGNFLRERLNMLSKNGVINRIDFAKLCGVDEKIIERLKKKYNTQISLEDMDKIQTGLFNTFFR